MILLISPALMWGGFDERAQRSRISCCIARIDPLCTRLSCLYERDLRLSVHACRQQHRDHSPAAAHRAGDTVHPGRHRGVPAGERYALLCGAVTMMGALIAACRSGGASCRGVSGEGAPGACRCEGKQCAKPGLAAQSWRQMLPPCRSSQSSQFVQSGRLMWRGACIGGGAAQRCAERLERAAAAGDGPQRSRHRLRQPGPHRHARPRRPHHCHRWLLTRITQPTAAL